MKKIAKKKLKMNEKRINNKIEFIFNKRVRCIFLGVLVATTFKSWIIIQIENDFSQNILAKAII
ncbi:hypothetical protein D0T84_12515 [Dysgonomonas sp. 521]|nr:hypothetical protein [Dysgonomonas sp. 521]